MSFDFDKINVGDKVVVCTYDWTGINERIATVEKKTPKTVTVNGIRYKKDGSQYSKERGWLEMITPEFEAKVRAKKHREAVLASITNVNWYSIPTDKLDQILAILGGENSDGKNNS